MKIIMRLLFFSALFLSGCSASQLEKTPSVEVVLPVIGVDSPTGVVSTDQSNPVGDYPAAELPGDNAYPAAIFALPTLPVGQLPSAPTDAPNPLSGKASVSGIIFSFTSHVAVPDTTVYLTAAIGDEKIFPSVLSGPNPSVGDIQGRTDTAGQIMFDNVPPGDYYLIVWGPSSWIPVVDPTADPPSPILFTFQTDQKYPLGVLQVSWP